MAFSQFVILPFRFQYPPFAGAENANGERGFGAFQKRPTSARQK